MTLFFGRAAIIVLISFASAGFGHRLAPRDVVRLDRAQERLQANVQPRPLTTFALILAAVMNPASGMRLVGTSRHPTSLELRGGSWAVPLRGDSGALTLDSRAPTIEISDGINAKVALADSDSVSLKVVGGTDVLQEFEWHRLPDPEPPGGDDHTRKPKPFVGIANTLRNLFPTAQKNEFKIGTHDFNYHGDLWFNQGQQSTVSGANRDDGLQLIMKRPKYTDENWEDNLKKESFISRYLNAAGVPRVATCIGERYFSAKEVRGFKADVPKADLLAEWDNDDRWHAIFLEKVPGQPQDKRNWGKALKLNNANAEKRAVRQMIETTSLMLKAGIVNGDQWHNILFTPDGDAHFIDLEGAKFINQAPLEVANAAGESLQYIERVRLPPKNSSAASKYEVQTMDFEKGLVLSSTEAEKAVAGMVGAILSLIPEHAMLDADEAMESRVRTGNERLDKKFDDVWQHQKAALLIGKK